MTTNSHEDTVLEAMAFIADKEGIDDSTMGTIFNGLQGSQQLCHGLAANWWIDLATGKRKTLDQVNIPEKLMLIVSEVSEAMEGTRKNLQDDKLPHRKMLEVELADALIRIFDLAGYLELDIAGATLEKLAYNANRADHKIENRLADDGKKF